MSSYIGNNNYINKNVDKSNSNNLNLNNSKHNKTKPDILYMLPKMERHIEYVLGLVLKLPRIEKFNIGQEMKLIVYDTLKNILYLSKVEIKYRMSIANVIDANISYEKSLIRCYNEHKIGYCDFSTINQRH